MAITALDRSAGAGRVGADLRALCAMMVLSGAAALAYEVVWMRLLTRAFGVTVHAVSALVAVYMGGLALGAAAAAQAGRGRRDWLRVYAVLEGASAASALAATWLMGRLPEIIARLGSDAPLNALWRVLLAAPVLAPPTLLMGATLPILVFHWERRLSKAGGAVAGAEEARSGVGTLYGFNTLGAVAGLLLAGFWSIGAWGETATVGCAALLNLTAAAAALALSGDASPPPLGDSTRSADPWSRRILWAAAVSGFCALGYEVLWARQLILLLGNSTYAFSALLAMYLAGIALGSHAAARLDVSGFSPLGAFGAFQAVLAGAVFWSLAAYRWLGLRFDSPDYLYSPLQGGGDVLLLFLQAGVLVLPASLAMGVLFPLALRVHQGGRDPAGASVGRLYAWNTAGGILGSLAAGFWGLACLGAHRSFLALAGINLALGAAMLRASGDISRGRARSWASALALLIAAAGLAAAGDPTLDILLGRLRRRDAVPPEILFHKESPAATITGVAYGPKRILLINGIETSGLGIPGALMAVLPNVFLENPRSALVICFGVGTTFRAASMITPEVHAVELVGGVVASAPYFYADAPEHLGRPGRAVFIDDGRSHLLRSRRLYDSIIVDAAPPLYSAGAVNLYTKEFLALARGRLTPEGVFTLWLPMASFEDDYWRILRNMADTFPHLAVWNHPAVSGILAFGSAGALALPPGTLGRRLKARVDPRLTGGMIERDALAGFRVTEKELRAYLRRFPPVTDDRPSTEFPLYRFLAREPVQLRHDFLLKAKGSRQLRISAPAIQAARNRGGLLRDDIE